MPWQDCSAVSLVALLKHRNPFAILWLGPQTSSVQEVLAGQGPK